MKVARSTYYSILNHKASSREIENNILKSKIFKVYCDNRKVYGCIKITRILRDNGYQKLSVNRVSRLMKQLGIRSVTIRKFKNYRNKQNEHSELKNLVNQNFSAQKPNQIWLSDITYIHTVKNGWTYLASVLDVCTRKIVGYSYGRKMDRSLVISALTKAWQNQNGAILKKWTAKSERWYNNKKGEKDMENTKYTEEFKQSIVSLYESGKSSTQICKEYGMSSSTLHKWIKKYTKVQVSETETMTMAEIKKMQKKLALLEEENIILKKAMAIFSRESGKE